MGVLKFEEYADGSFTAETALGDYHINVVEDRINARLHHGVCFWEEDLASVEIAMQRCEEDYYAKVSESYRVVPSGKVAVGIGNLEFALTCLQDVDGGRGFDVFQKAIDDFTAALEEAKK